MSCCNEKIKDSDLIDLSFVTDSCRFNDLTRNTLDVLNVSVANSACCSLERFVVRFEELSNDRVMFTYEDTEKGTVDFVEAVKAIPEQSVESLFKQLTEVNALIRAKLLKAQLEICTDHLIQADRVTRLVEHSEGYRIVRLKPTLGTELDLKFETIKHDLDPSYMSENDFQLQVISRLPTGPLSTLMGVIRTLGFNAVGVEVFGSRNRSLKIHFVKAINDHALLQLTVTVVNRSDQNLINTFKDYTVSC